MASTHNATLYYSEQLPRKKMGMAMQVVKVGFCGPKKAERCYMVRAKSSSYKGVDVVNGEKVNGVHVGGVPYLGQRSTKLVKEKSNSSSSSSSSGGDHAYLLGRFVEDRVVYRQTFVIRSYEIGPDKTATMETLMNLLQVISF